MKSFVAGGLAALVSMPTFAQLPINKTPFQLEGVGIVERLNETIPLDLEFTDQNGKTVRLGDFFKQGKPVILTPVFYECPMLCTLVLNGLVDGLNDVEWSVGEEVEIVTFSFNPREKHKLAEVKRRAYLTQYRRDSARQSWPFLTGSEENIKALTDTLGYHYRYDQKQEVYVHSASIMFLTPDGRLSRYMNDVLYDPRDLRLALIEASEGTIGSPMEQILLFTCFQYDPNSNSYVLSARKIMRWGGVLTLIVIAAGVFFLSRRRAKHHEMKETIPIDGLKT